MAVFFGGINAKISTKKINHIALCMLTCASSYFGASSSASQKNLTLLVTNPDRETSRAASITVPISDMPLSFVSDRESLVIHCPRGLDQAILKSALEVVKKSLQVVQNPADTDNTKIGEDKKKPCEDLVQLLKGNDTERIGLLIDALEFFEIDHETLRKVTCELEKEFNMVIEKNLVRRMARENLRTVFDMNEDQRNFFREPSTRLRPPTPFGLRNFAKRYIEQITEPQADAIRKTALGFLLVATPNKFVVDQLDEASWKSFEIFCSSNASPENYVGKKLDRTLTEIGCVSFYSKFARGNTTVAACTAQRELVKYLVEKKAVTDRLISCLKVIQESEKVALAFWDSSDDFDNIYHQQLFDVGSLKKWEWAKKLAETVNSDSRILELSKRGEQALIFGSTVSPLVGGLGTIYSMRKSMSWQQIGGAIVLALAGFYRNIQQLPDTLENLVIPCLVYQIKLMYLADYLKAIDTILTELEQFEKEGNFPSPLKKLVEELSCIKSNNILKELWQDLRTNTFVGGLGDRDFTSIGSDAARIFMTNSGKILATYGKVHTSKHLLVPIFAAVGELDAQLSIVSLFNEFAGKKVAYCWPEFKEVPEPSIEATQVWNPMVNTEHVVPNSLTLGIPGASHGAVFTGPNGGGKTTIMKSFPLAIIIAQSLGIAPAQSLKFTPFKKVKAYLNIVDDTAGGRSLFVAGVKRALELYESARTNSHSLTVFDELFNSTGAAEGQAAGCSLLEMLLKYRSNIFLSTTHFQKLTEIKGVDNYKVTVQKTPEGKLHYPFELQHGSSNQNIAFDVLREQGFNEEMIVNAERILRGQ